MLRKLFLNIGGRWLGSELHAVAEGKRGEFAKGVYWFMAGKKTITGLVFGALAVGLAALNLGDATAFVSLVAGILVTAGLLDGRWRSQPKWETSPIWALVRDHSADVVALLGAGAAYFTTCTPATQAMLAHVHMTCGGGIGLMTVATAVFTWLMGEAQLATPPRETRGTL